MTEKVMVSLFVQEKQNKLYLVFCFHILMKSSELST